MAPLLHTAAIKSKPKHTQTRTTVSRPFFRDHPGEPVPEEKFWTSEQGKINRGRHIDHPAGCHSIRTNQCPPPPFPIFFTGRMPFLPPNQQCKSTEGNKPKHKPTNKLHMYAYHCAVLEYTTQYRTVLIIFPLILQTMVVTQKLSKWTKRR